MSVKDIRGTRPFHSSAEEYLEAGWIPLPLPPRKKNPVPKRVTGRYDPPTRDDVEGWLVTEPQRANIAIRVPDGVVGIDVDCYDGKPGAETLRALEKKLGPLPPTWTLTSRKDGKSGIRFYTVPRGQAWPGQLGPSVEIIQFRYRFAVAWPSVHPDTGDVYHWYEPGAPLDGEHCYRGIPNLRDLVDAGVA